MDDEDKIILLPFFIILTNSKLYDDMHRSTKAAPVYLSMLQLKELFLILQMCSPLFSDHNWRRC